MDVGEFCVIDKRAVIGHDAVIGNFCKIDRGVTIHDGTVLRDYVELRCGTVIGPHCIIDSRVSSSGENLICAHSTIRYGAIIARGCHIGEHCYICPQVMTNNVDHHMKEVGGARIGQCCFIGTQTVLAAGIEIAQNTIVGSCSFVTKSITEPGGIYLGVPAKRR